MEEKLWNLAIALTATIVGFALDELAEAIKKARKKTPPKSGKHAKRS